jgi:hypothetical protein
MKKETIDKAGKAYAEADAMGMPSSGAVRFAMGKTGLSRADVLRAFNTGRKQEPSNWHKKARAIATKEADKQGLDKRIRAGLRWWRKLLAKIFPRLRRRYDAWVKARRKKIIKLWKREVYKQLVTEREERERFARVQARAMRKRAHESLKRREMQLKDAGVESTPGLLSVMHDSTES